MRCQHKIKLKIMLTTQIINDILCLQHTKGVLDMKLHEKVAELNSTYIQLSPSNQDYAMGILRSLKYAQDVTQQSNNKKEGNKCKN